MTASKSPPRPAIRPSSSRPPKPRRARHQAHCDVSWVPSFFDILSDSHHRKPTKIIPLPHWYSASNDTLGRTGAQAPAFPTNATSRYSDGTSRPAPTEPDTPCPRRREATARAQPARDGPFPRSPHRNGPPRSGLRAHTCAHSAPTGRQPIWQDMNRRNVPPYGRRAPCERHGPSRRIRRRDREAPHRAGDARGTRRRRACAPEKRRAAAPSWRRTYAPGEATPGVPCA